MPRAELQDHINVFFSAEDKAFTADVPDLKYCSAHGQTPEAALRQVRVAMRAWVKAAKSAGRRVPKPRYRPAIYLSAS